MYINRLVEVNGYSLFMDDQIYTAKMHFEGS